MVQGFGLSNLRYWNLWDSFLNLELIDSEQNSYWAQGILFRDLDELGIILPNSFSDDMSFKSMVSRWETGIAVPDNKHVVAYAQYFDIDMNYLMGLTNVKRKLSNITYSNDSEKDEEISEIVHYVKSLNKSKLKQIKELIYLIGNSEVEKLEAIIKIFK